MHPSELYRRWHRHREEVVWPQVTEGGTPIFAPRFMKHLANEPVPSRLVEVMKGPERFVKAHLVDFIFNNQAQEVRVASYTRWDG